jgi:hypothetical protein
MPHNSRSRWRDRIRSVRLEYSAIKVSLAWLLTADPAEIHDVAEDNEEDDPHPGAVTEAYNNLAATYFIRMFSMFEIAIKSYWKSLPGNAGGQPDAIVAINDVGVDLTISNDTIDQAQRIRELRNDLIHEWNRPQVVTVDLPGEMNHLIEFLDYLPSTWP